MSLSKILERHRGDDAPIPIREYDVPGKESNQRESVLYAATNLKSWETGEPHRLARDVGIAGICFRRLDPDYYAWLRHKMDLAEKAAGSRRLSTQAFDTLRTRFNTIPRLGHRAPGRRGAPLGRPLARSEGLRAAMYR